VTSNWENKKKKLAGIPNNLMPFVAQVAIGKREVVNVFGNDYETPDGTGVRDYIHVVDLAVGHVAALKRFESATSNFEVYNLGTGKGYSVLEMVKAMGKACGKELPVKIGPRRAGDVASMYADPAHANKQVSILDSVVTSFFLPFSLHPHVNPSIAGMECVEDPGRNVQGSVALAKHQSKWF